MTQQLAKHCALESLTHDQAVLCLAEEHKHLQTRMATDNLQAALSDYFARPIKLSIVLGKTAVATPAKIEHQNQQTRQNQANDSIAQDAFVKEAQTSLAASLAEIKPV